MQGREAPSQSLIEILRWSRRLDPGEREKRTADRDQPVAVEFVATSISSGYDGPDQRPGNERFLANNPQIRFNNNQRGYVRHVVTPARWQADFRVLDKVSVADGRLTTRRSFVVESGRAALLDAGS